ncbi:glycosyltransferase family 2 protein [Akkermansiaceae bacterium]|nr:glycosyltransferase family 2 protein [Akkermansiaceae bacterium]MDB4386855.1 glycosyltransferase family 2 protein [Akkermansiaceae bacterium]
MPHLISGIVITFNEEKNITRCLKSLKRVCDELVVVDSHSTDSTVEIAKALGAKIFQHPFEGHIEQKNFALQQAKHDFCLSLDADECLDEEATASILSLKEETSVSGYSFNRLNNYLGTWIRHGSWYPDRKLRLWDRRVGKWGGRNPHDHLNLEQGNENRHLPGNILHYKIDSLGAHVKQLNFFTEIAAEELFQKGRSARLIDLVMRPVFRFFRDYLLKRGFLDGRAGFLIAVISTFGIFLKYAKLSQLEKSTQKDA